MSHFVQEVTSNYKARYEWNKDIDRYQDKLQQA